MWHRLIPIVAIGLTPSVLGCQWLGRRGPVPQSLRTSRQLCQLGISAIERDQWEQAEQVLAQAVRTCPSDPDARRYYAQALWHGGEREQAVAQLEEASRLAGENATFRVLLAEMRLAMDQVGLARRSAQSAVDLDPKLAAAWAMRGRVAQASAKPRQALADYHRALSLAPDDRAIRLDIAELYCQLNEPQRALAALQGLADTYSPGEEPQRVLYLQGLAYAAMERWEDAVQSLSAAGARESPTPEILFQLGRTQFLAGRPDEAAAAAREALALNPEHRPSRELLGRMGLAVAPDGTFRR